MSKCIYIHQILSFYIGFGVHLIHDVYGASFTFCFMFERRAKIWRRSLKEFLIIKMEGIDNADELDLSSLVEKTHNINVPIGHIIASQKWKNSELHHALQSELIINVNQFMTKCWQNLNDTRPTKNVMIEWCMYICIYTLFPYMNTDNYHWLWHVYVLHAIISDNCLC